MSIALEPSCRNLHLPVQCFPQGWSFPRHFQQTFQQIPVVTITIIIEFSNQNLFFIQVPSTEEEWINISAQFNELWNFPNCIGAMDGKHIQMRRPINSGSYYFNYKGFFSIVLLGLVDADYKFIYIDVGCNDRISDGGVYRNPSLSQALSENRLNVPAAQAVANSDVVLPYVIAADDAFPLKDHIMKPYPICQKSKEYTTIVLAELGALWKMHLEYLPIDLEYFFPRYHYLLIIQRKLCLPAVFFKII